MKTLLFIMFSVLLLHVKGQNHFIGIKAGENWTSNSNRNYSAKNGFRTGLSGGLTYEYLLNNHFSIGADFVYDQRGFTYAFAFDDYLGNHRTTTTKFDHDHLAFPITAGLTVGKKIYSFANIGISPSLLLNAEKQENITDTDGEIIAIEKYEVTNSMQKFDMSGLIEIGGGYKVTDRFWLYALLAYQHSFITSSSSDYHTNEEFIRYYGTNLYMCLKYALAGNINGQPGVPPVMDDYFLQRSKTQKKTGWIILGSGLGIAALGGIVQAAKENQGNGSWNFDFTGLWIAIGGGCVSLSSIPFFISSGVNARKAATLTLSSQQVFIPQQNIYARTTVPSTTLKINF
jgi:hypothetical protein